MKSIQRPIRKAPTKTSAPTGGLKAISEDHPEEQRAAADQDPGQGRVEQFAEVLAAEVVGVVGLGGGGVGCCSDVLIARNLARSPTGANGVA